MTGVSSEPTRNISIANETFILYQKIHVPTTEKQHQLTVMTNNLLLVFLFAFVLILSYCESFLVEHHDYRSTFSSRTALQWRPLEQPRGAGGFHHQQQRINRSLFSSSTARARVPSGGGDSFTFRNEQILRVASRQPILHELLSYTNIKRCNYGLGELSFNAELSKAAQHHADCMASNGYLSHWSAVDGSDPAQRVTWLTNYRYARLGENIFWKRGSPTNNNPKAAVQGWMKSPSHRKNILNQEFTEIGLGYSSNGENHYYVQVFGRPHHHHHATSTDPADPFVNKHYSRHHSVAEYRQDRWLTEMRPV